MLHTIDILPNTTTIEIVFSNFRLCFKFTGQIFSSSSIRYGRYGRMSSTSWGSPGGYDSFTAAFLADQ